MEENEIEDNVKFIRMNTGEDIVSQVFEINENDISSFMFINPLKILYQVGSGSGYLQISLMEWVFTRICSKQEFVISSNDILTISEPADHLIRYYWETIDHFERQRDKKEAMRFSEQSDMLEEESIYEKEPDEVETIKQLLSDIKNNSNKRKLH